MHPIYSNFNGHFMARTCEFFPKCLVFFFFPEYFSLLSLYDVTCLLMLSEELAQTSTMAKRHRVFELCQVDVMRMPEW